MCPKPLLIVYQILELYQWFLNLRNETIPSDSKCALISLLLKKYSVLSSVPPSCPPLIFFFSGEKQMTSPGPEGALWLLITVLSLSSGQFWAFLGSNWECPLWDTCLPSPSATRPQPGPHPVPTPQWQPLSLVTGLISEWPSERAWPKVVNQVVLPLPLWAWCNRFNLY